MSVTISDFGFAADGTPVRMAVLKNEFLQAQVLSYGAILHRLYVKDRRGNPVDVVLGYPAVEDYRRNAADAMGAVVGRFANRIGGAAFYLYEQQYHVTANEKGNCLHSGLHGFAQTVFELEKVPEEEAAVRLTAESPDGTDGFPGNLQLEVEYSLAGRALVLRYYATSDAPTVVNITNHSYFNLNGHASGSAMGHRLTLESPAYLETDQDSIPTGRVIPVAGTPMDFNEEKTLGRDIGQPYPALVQGSGYDHCYLLPDSGLRHIAWLSGPMTGIRMELLTTQPGVQLYTGNYLAPVTPGKDGVRYAARDGICLETQNYPDSPNHPEFPDCTLLPDQTYDETTVYKFDLAPQ